MLQNVFDRLPIDTRPGRLLENGLLFSGFVAAIWIASQSDMAPQLLLLMLLYVVVVNFSVPARVGYVGLTPIVAISSLLTVGVNDALLTAAVGLPLAELMRPTWKPLWQAAAAERLPLIDRAGLAVLTWINLALVSLTWLPLLDDGQQSLISWVLADIPNTTVDTFAPIFLSVVYFVVYILLSLVYWLVRGAGARAFFVDAGGYLAGTTFFAVPLTLFVASAEIGMPAFVLLCIGVAAFAIITWSSWQRRYLTVQQLAQFQQLNAVGASLRETLVLDEVIGRTQSQITKLINAERIFLALINEDGTWDQPLISSAADGSTQITVANRFEPDDLTRWVVENGRLLDLEPNNMHHARRHNIAMPTPRPRVWLGVPLQTQEETIGAIVLQKFNDGEPFSRWNRELLLSVAGQASAAIQNARLHSETVRLYNLTDEALARRVEQLQALLYSITEGVLMVDTTGRVVLINPTAAQMIGQRARELRGTLLDVEAAAEPLGYSVADLDGLLMSISAETTPQNGSTPNRHEYELPRNDDRRIFMRDEIAVTSDEGQLMGWLMVFRDVTEERDRAEWRADLTRMIVHDLRNPITTLSSTVNLIEGRLPQEHKPMVADLVTNARHGTANMLEMVDSLMDINRAEVGRFVIDQEAMRMTRLAETIVAMIKPLAIQRDIALSFEWADDVPAVWGDEEILRRVMVNLVDNALKFTPANGRVRGVIETEPAIPEHEPGVRVTIYDDGPGIPPERRRMIFERFVTFNRGGGQIRGTGLGLTFCKLAVEAHGGTVSVDDAPGGGSAFSFTVPGIPVF